jgi:hypothetical protein
MALKHLLKSKSNPSPLVNTLLPISLFGKCFMMEPLLDKVLELG